MQTRVRFTLAVVLALALASLVAAPTAFAGKDDNGTSLDTASASAHVSEVDLSDFPNVRFAFSADEVDGRQPNIRIKENGTEVGKVELYRGAMGSFEDRSGSDIMLLIDNSLSMKSPRIDGAITAANALIDHAHKGDRIGVGTFGGDAKVLVEPTSDIEAARGALQGIELAERTTMFDAVRLAAKSFDRERSATRAIVVLSDGADVGSKASASDAIRAANKADAAIVPVSIQAEGVETPRDMQKLASSGGVAVRTVNSTASLASLFDELGRQLLQSYWVEYRSKADVGKDVRISVGVNGSSAPDGLWRYSAPALPAGPDGLRRSYHQPRPVQADKPLLPVPSGVLGVLFASLPFALMLFFLTYSSLQRRSRPDIVARIEMYTARATAVAIKETRTEGSLLRQLSQPFVKISESMLGRTAFFARIKFLADQANIAIKPAELFAIQVAGASFGALVGLLFGRVLLLAILTVVFGCAPFLWLKMRAKKRRKAFEGQLADVLGGISSSLKAGHSFNQSLNAVVKDTPNPTAEEFQRVMTEARLGLPLEVALQGMADRMGSPDFDFAVTTVNIQRTVGGSLADILQMVGETVRNRQQFRKKVKALTSMGQMSAYVLLAMPIFIGLVIGLMSPSYMKPLLFTPIGHFMLAGACISMVFGYFVCMKIVDVKV